MKNPLENAITVVAQKNADLRSFSPYVASINDLGLVAFQATFADGGSRVCLFHHGTVRVLADDSEEIVAVTSHPDVGNDGSISFYARLSTGGEGLVMVSGGEVSIPVQTGAGLERIGPLGPTMNHHGAVAFRGLSSDAGESLWLLHGDIYDKVADATDGFADFAGLPVVNQHLAVAFHGIRQDGGRGIYLRQHDELLLVADDRQFSELGLFPSFNDHNVVAFCGTHRKLGPGVYVFAGGRLARHAGHKRFASYRGALVNDEGPFVFYATPESGRLALFCGPDPTAHRLFGIGDSLLGSSVTEFAVNPVSANNVGQLAVRVALENGSQAILTIAVNS